jgi:hypothetical protein
MNLRYFLMAGGVAVAAYLAFVADKSAEGNGAEAIVRTPATSASRPVSTSPVAPLATSAKMTAGPSTAAVTLAPAAQPGKSVKAERVIPILRLQARASLISDGRGDKPGETVFQPQSWNPPPPPPPKVQAAPPPMAPPLSFSYLGKMKQDGAWEVYLARGEKVFIARAGSIIEGVYQVNAIAPPTLSLTYLPLKQVQALTIGVSD